ncbi:hypothetical protein ACS5NO_12815 [Larkinella sp. GY13]|uniref:hypothetical protein n=1 Tax=Larkinella sp. GY13 TaxID=3453720 RepID=UPI003EED02FF
MITRELYWNYFQPLATAIAPEGLVLMAEADRMERLLTASVNKKIYPAVFSMRPAYKVIDNGAEQFALRFSVIFYVFCKSKAGDEASQEAAFDQAEEIALAIIKQLRRDHLETVDVDFDYNSAALEPVTLMTLDATQGYEVKLQLVLAANEVFRNYFDE